MNVFSRMSRVAVFAVVAALAAPAMADDDHYSKADLDQMLAPIALYPDSVLSHVLIAATYPLDVAQAARWSRSHPDLQGEDAVDAVDGRDWDASVKALVAFPEILARMDDDLDWTERLGDAFLDNEGEVMDRVQFLRARAYEEGNLDTEHTRVIRERETIYIEPALTDVVFVPYYDPWFVYGSWWWPEYPPYCWDRWGGRPVGYYRPGFYWGVGFRIAPSFYFASFQWSQRQVVVLHDHRRPMYSGRDARHFDDVSVWRHQGERVRGMHSRSERAPRSEPGRRWSGPRGEDRAAAPARRERRREPMDERVERNQWRQEERRELRRQPPEPRRQQQGERASRGDERGSRARESEPMDSRGSDSPRESHRSEGRQDRGREARGTSKDAGQRRGGRQRQENR